MSVSGSPVEVPCDDLPQAIPAGSTLSLAGSVVLPGGTWTGELHVLDLRDPEKGGTGHSSAGTVTMTKGSAVNDGTGAFNWSLLLEQPASVTAGWPQPPDMKKLITLYLGIRFKDGSVPPKEIAMTVPFPVSKMLVPRS